MKYRSQRDREVVQAPPLRRRGPSGAGLAVLYESLQQGVPRGRPAKQLVVNIGLAPDDTALAPRHTAAPAAGTERVSEALR